MYREKALKRTIIFMRIRRYIFIFAFVILGLAGAFVVSEFLTDIARLDQQVGNIIMIATAISIFLIGFVLTSALEFRIQQAYLEMKILKRLNVVSFKLTKLLENQGVSLSDELDKYENSSLMTPKKSKKFRFKKEKKQKKVKNNPEEKKDNEFIEKLKVDL
ncbi:MAG: hypothetical protein IKG42_01330 [Clostridia bacterium]|nr:hypothetical protein [Clostridia bacterium]